MLLTVWLALQSGFEHRVTQRQELLEVNGGTEATEAAVSAALDWLEAHQSADGSWGMKRYDACGSCSPDGIHQAVDVTKHNYDVGITALSVLAFLGAGRTHRESDAVLDGVKFLLLVQDREGCVGSRDTEQYMYNHTLATLCLAEAYGMTGSRKLKVPAQRAVDFLTAAQNPGKGWRYIFQAGENDSSVTGWAVAALRAAKLAGLEFDRKVAYSGARNWYNQVSYRQGERWKAGYQFGADADIAIPGINDHFDQHPTMTAIGMYARTAIDRQPEFEMIAGGVPVLLDDLPRWEGPAIDFLYWYWATLALHEVDAARGLKREVADASAQARPLIRSLGAEDADVREAASKALIELGEGALAEVEKACASADPEVAVRAKRIRREIRDRLPREAGDAWRDWNEAIVAALVANQNVDGHKRGSWEPVGRWCCKAGRVYATAINALTLEAYYRYRPAAGR